MAKKIFILSALFLILFIGIFALSACSDDSISGGQLDVSYNVKAAVDTSRDTVYVTEEVSVKNDTEYTLSSLCFYLYPNAYGEEGGGIQIGNVVCNQRNLIYNIDNINMSVELIEPIESGESSTLTLTARVSVPTGEGRMGKTEDGDYNLHAFFPRLAYFGEGSFKLTPYSEIGDPYYFGEDDFVLSVEAPKEYAVAHAGTLMERVESEESAVTSFSIDNARDISLTLGCDFKVYEGESEGVKIYHYTRAEDETAFIAECISGLSELIGEYPYESFTVAETAYEHGGMEYSSFVNVARDLRNRREVILHELLHQWFGLSVGSNSYAECWVDESLTQYLTYYYMDIYSGGGYAENIEREKECYRSFLKAGKREYGDGYQPKINATLGEFRSLTEYAEVVYGYGTLMYDGVLSVCGEAKLIKAIRGYYADYKGKISTGDALIESFSRHGTKKIGCVFRSYMEGTVVISGC